jgi:Holliday junction resolvase RusA-like endonuclease
MTPAITMAAGKQFPTLLAGLPAHAITFTVAGKSATKGSSVAFMGDEGRIIHKADNRRLRAWSELVAWSARAARVRCVKKPGAVAVCLLLMFARPKGRPVDQFPFCIDPPDVDKCVRAAFDALTGIAYEDDAQVIHQSVDKVYDDEPRVVITLWEVRP